MDASSTSNPQPPVQKTDRKIILPTLFALLLAILVALGFYLYILFSPNAAILPVVPATTGANTVDANAITLLQTQQQQMAQEIATLRAQIPQISNDTGRTEVLYYLHLADTATTILKNVPMALQLLQRAKTQVDATPELQTNTALQQALADDITALQTVKLPDFQQLAATISTLEQNALTLPFKDETPKQKPEEVAPAQPVSFWKSVWQDIGMLLQYVVQVQRADKSSAPYFLFPEQKALLREQIRVQLEQLLLAAMSHDTSLYQSKLTEIQNSVNYFFDAKQEQTVQFSQQLAALANEVLEPELPAANHSLLLLEQENKR